MAAKSPVEFVRQARGELQKVTWPSRQEIVTSTIAVFAMVFVAAMFLFLADQVMSRVVQWVLNIGM
jgi:preprotein translocase subunit SecE